jgi:glycerol-3-phosphate acyltransferase PlsX
MVIDDKRITIAIDLMGGDNAPVMPIDGLKIASEKHPHIIFKIFGNRSIISRKCPDFDFNKYDFVDCPIVISSHEQPSKALRNSKNSSMRCAIESVSKGESDAIISAGNTGALMAISKLILKTLSSIDRPAICTFIPTKKNPCLMLDVGANINCEPRNLLEFAVMGDAFLSATLGNKKGKIGILNIGTEDTKGHSILREANVLLQNSAIKDRYIGYVEPHKVFDGEVDIIVTDGFNGNIFIKTAEGIGGWMKQILTDAFDSSMVARIGYLFTKQALKKSMKIIDPRNYNGAMFVGLNGISIKSHGGTDAIGFAKAVDSAIVLVHSKINKKIGDLISQYDINL